MKLRHLYICFVTLIVNLLPTSNACAQNTQTNWTFLGKINAVCNIEKYWDNGDKEDCYWEDTKMVHLYSSFDGEKMEYKIYVPAKDEVLRVKKSQNYTGATIVWSRNNKHIIKIPPLSEMYTHYAVGFGQTYYFNADNPH